jgi:hypothetical protein
MKKLTVGVCVVLIALAWPRAGGGQGAGRQQPAAPHDERGVLAVLRRDGVMLPFAAFKGSSWSVPWPEALRYQELPITVASVPDRWWGGWRPDSWEAWLPDGSHRPLELDAPITLRLACNTRLGFKTSYRASLALPPVPTEPFPKEGLAVAGGVRVDPIEIVDRSAAAWGALAIALLGEFDHAEDREISAAAAGSGWRHPVRTSDRRARAVRIESWYRTIDYGNGGTVSWIEAVRSYPPRPEDEGCGLETFFSGWVYHDKGETAPRADLSARLMYCDRVGAAYMLPFGSIRLRQSSYWVYQLAGYDSEWYAVARLGRPRIRVVAEYFAGRCAR